MTPRRLSRSVHLSLIVGLLGASLLGCGSEREVDSSAPGTLVSSDKQRISDPQVDSTTLGQLSADNTAFALDLHGVLPADENSFYSPISISLALAMTYAGARNNTAAEMAQALHFNLPQADLHPAFNSLDLALASRGQGAAGKDGGAFRLNVVNALWGQQDFSFEADFLDTLALNYGAGLRLLDFVHQTEASRQAINAWVAEQTEERIKDLIPEGAIDTLTRLVLTNAIYFNAAWASTFEASQTKTEPFVLADGGQVEVQMMNQVEQLGYAQGSDWQAVDLPYDGHELSMLLVLPAAGKLAQVEAALTSAQIEDMVADLQTHKVTLALPQFKVESKFSLVEALRQLGMVEAFSDFADFSGMTGQVPLKISDVIHQSFIAVDEAGTEAAAATAVIMGEVTSMPLEYPKVTVRLDRPFLFLIRDRASGSVLFVGRILNPAA